MVEMKQLERQESTVYLLSLRLKLRFKNLADLIKQ